MQSISKYTYFGSEIKSLYPDEIFVFGSNLAGVHGSGAARKARVDFGAVYGKGVGFTGQCYALPTKDENIETMPLDEIKVYVDAFLKEAAIHTDKIFLVTKVGCGLAGYTNDDIAPMFKGAPTNCYFDLEWRDYLETN